MESGPGFLSGPHSGLSVREWAARRTAKRAWHRCEHGQQESMPSVRSGKGDCDTNVGILCTSQNPHSHLQQHLLTLLLTRPPPPWVTLLFSSNNSQSQALEAEARRGLESEMMCMSKGPQTFQSQVLPEVILDLDPREGEGLRTATPSRSSPQLAWIDVFARSPASQDAQVIVCFPSSWKQWQMCLH